MSESSGRDTPTAAIAPQPEVKLLALIEWCCTVAQGHIDKGNYGWAEFTMARAQQAAETYATLAKVGLS